jgi:hypothetical protein
MALVPFAAAIWFVCWSLPPPCTLINPEYQGVYQAVDDVSGCASCPRRCKTPVGWRRPSTPLQPESVT